MVDFQNSCREFIHMEDYTIFQPYRYERLKIFRSSIPHAYTFAHHYAYAKSDMTKMKLQFGKTHSKDT